MRQITISVARRGSKSAHFGCFCWRRGTGAVSRPGGSGDLQPTAARAVTHLDVTADDIDVAIAAAREVLTA